MRKSVHDKKVAALSKRAQKLYQRVRRGDVYQTHARKTPAAMAELEAAGLVMRGVRAVVFVAAFVPHDAKPLRDIQRWVP